MRFCLASLSVLVLVLVGPLRADNLGVHATLFDPARHMHVSEVRPGMTGYGLSVFEGTKIEKFDVEVVSVLKNFNPKYDVVLIRCTGDYLKHTGSIAGMSGSPIFLKDDEGRERMIGAFAYGWPMTKDPLAGVQPIEYMLDMPLSRGPTLTAEASATTQPGGKTKGLSQDDHQGLSWSLAEAGLLPFHRPQLNGTVIDQGDGRAAMPRLGMSEPLQLQPLLTPLMAGGLSPELLKQAAPLFRSYGLTPLRAGGGSASPGEPVKLAPGSVLAVPLLTGDVDLTAIGTVTEVIGDHVFGFGHPFNNEGVISLPMGSGRINGVIPNLQTSFKLGALAQDLGCLTTDEAVGVAGRLGGVPPTVPMEFHVSYADGSAARTYRFRAALHPKFTPMLAGLAMAAAISGPSELPQYNTLDYSLKLDFANGRTLTIADTAVNANVQELFAQLGIPITAAAENPFERVQIKHVSGTIQVSSTPRQAQIIEVNLPRSRFRQGETLKAYVAYKAYRGPQGIMPVELDLPRDLPQGTYQLIISDAQRYVQDELLARPFRFTAGNVKEVFGVLKDMAAIRQNALYLRLLRQSDGVAVGRTALPQLPSSRRQILLGAGRSNITPFVSSTTKTVPSEMVMSGSAEFTITIDPRAKVEVAGPKANPTAPVPVAKPEPRRKAAADSESSAKDKGSDDQQDQ